MSSNKESVGIHSVRSLLSVLLIALGSLTTVTPVNAVTVDVSAEFRPNKNDPTHMAFTNTTPCSLPGATQAWCTLPNGNTPVVASVNVPKRMVQSADEEEAVFIRTPGQRTLVVTNENGESHNLSLEITDMGYMSRGASAALHNLTNGRLADPANGNCSNGGRNHTGISNDSYFLWHVDEAGWNSGTQCSRGLKAGSDDNTTVRNLYVGYRLLTPNPYGMSNGIYSGSIDYTLSQNGDFSVGKGSYSQTITFKFELKVIHELSVRIPAGNERVVLAPPGGWNQWQAGSSAPSLKRDVLFYINTSGPIIASLQCQYNSGPYCALKSNQDGSEVPFRVALTIPNLGTRVTPVKNFELFNVSTTPTLYSPDYLYNQASHVHFSVESTAVAEMLKQPGSVWKGNTTVIFDAMP